MANGTAKSKWTRKIRTIPPVMVLKESGDARMRFEFRSLRWGIGTAFFAALISFFAWHLTHRQDVPLVIRLFVYLLAMVFTYSTVRSFTMHRSLTIDFTGQVVRLREKTLWSKDARTDGFDQFKRITVGHTDYRSSNYAIALEYKDGWSEFLGWSEFGAMSLKRAMELVNSIAPKMGIEINAPTYFEEKPLKGK